MTRQNRLAALLGLSLALLLVLSGCGQGGGSSSQIQGSSSAQSSSGESQQSSSSTPQTESSQGDSSSQSSTPSAGPVDGDGAYDIALGHAGLTRDQAVLMKLERDRDHGRDQYEVDFFSGGKKYDYEIDAATGAILKMEVENSGLSPDAVSIGLEEDRQIALNRVPGATEEHIHLELDVDDGYAIYEGEIYYQQTEYEFEIDARTGALLEWKMESAYD